MRWNNIFGMQTQYVLRYKPPGPGGETKSLLSPNVNMQDANRTCFRLQQFAFVGMTDLWEASICPFHKQLGGIDDS
jgi:tagatose-1,6-bisphosphate aldolase non-catalytic subunit AgaZ/GatZ